MGFGRGKGVFEGGKKKKLGVSRYKKRGGSFPPGGGACRREMGRVTVVWKKIKVKNGTG